MKSILILLIISLLSTASTTALYPRQILQ